MKIRIDKNIPIPEIRKVGQPAIYPFRKMEISDSFLIHFNGTPRDTTIVNIVHYWNKTLKPRRFLSRRLKNGYRIWRIR